MINLFPEKRFGKFYVQQCFIEDDLKILKKIMGLTVVIRAEYLIHASGIEYVAYSDEFDIVKNSEEIPIYDAGYEKETGEVFFTKRNSS